MVPSASTGDDSWTSSGLDFLISVDRRGRGLSAALQQAVRDAICAGRLHPGDPLPSTRALARDLGAARGTVVETYEQLVAEGWLVARHGLGTRVADLPAAPPAPAEPPAVPAPRHDLRPGHADPSSFPRQAWAAATRRVLAEAPDEAFGYADPGGRAELRAALAGYLGRARGVRATAASLQVCAGAGHGLGIAFRALAARGARILAVEDPSSPRMREIAAGAGLEVVPLACDDLGARVGELPALGTDAVVVTPAHQYPLGVTLGPERRVELLAWASSTGGIIIEDDYDGELRYDRQPVGALQGLDPGRVIYVGTTSKSLAAALRVGWLVVPPQLTGAVVETIRLINAWPPSLEQLALARFIEAGMFDRHIRRMRGVYRKRRDLLTATLAGHAPMLRVAGIAAGGHALVRLPAGGPGEHELIAKAALAGLALDGLSSYRVSDVLTEQRDHQPALVIGYGTPAGRSYRAAVAALGNFLRSTYPPPSTARRAQPGAGATTRPGG
jgi:GntR family transcriptional regulator / MocR family aminotransferase